MGEHWSVTVTRNGEEVVTIESNCLSGRDLRPDDDAYIDLCARALLGFIGRCGSPQSADVGDPISEAEDKVNCPRCGALVEIQTTANGQLKQFVVDGTTHVCTRDKQSTTKPGRLQALRERRA